MLVEELQHYFLWRNVFGETPAMEVIEVCRTKEKSREFGSGHWHCLLFIAVKKFVNPSWLSTQSLAAAQKLGTTIDVSTWT